MTSPNNSPDNDTNFIPNPQTVPRPRVAAQIFGQLHYAQKTVDTLSAQLKETLDGMTPAEIQEYQERTAAQKRHWERAS